MPPASKIRLFLVDNQTIVREALELLLAQAKDFVVVGSTPTWPQAVAKAPALQPHIFIVDSWKVRLDADAARALLASTPGAKLLLLTALADPPSVQALLEAGATGYVSKIDSSPDLFRAIRVVAAGGVEIEAHMLERLRSLKSKPREQALQKDLSEREERVLQLIAQGYTNKNAAALLKVSEKTVETYRLRAMRKIGARTKPDLMRAASERGWLTR